MNLKYIAAVLGLVILQNSMASSSNDDQTMTRAEIEAAETPEGFPDATLGETHIRVLPEEEEVLEEVSEQTKKFSFDKPEDFFSYGIPEPALRKAFAYYQKNFSTIKRRRYITIVDFTRSRAERRMHILDLTTGDVRSMTVSHGAGSGRDYVESVSNVSGSHKSSKGIYLTAETYYSDNPGIRLRVDGKEPTNSRARSRLIVIHGADYVTEDYAGNSQGCFVVSWRNLNWVVSRLKGGSVLYAYFPN